MATEDDARVTPGMVDAVVAKMVAIDAATPAPVFVPLPDDQVNHRDGLIGHLDGVGVRSMTTLTKTIDVGDPFEATTTAYALEDGVVRNVDEWGDHSDHLDLDVDEAHLAVEELEREGWEVVGYETVDSRLDAARNRERDVHVGEFQVRDSTGFAFTFATQCEHQRAERLAKARQELAAKGTGYNPAWEELNEDERIGATVAARHYLRAAINAGLMDDCPVH